MPYPSLLHPEPLPLQQSTADPSSIGDTQTQLYLSFSGVSGFWCTHSLFEPSEHLWWVWSLILNAISHLLPSCSSFSFALGHGVSPQSRTSALPAALAPTVLLGLLCTCTWGISPQRLQHCAASTPALRSTLSTFDFR